MAVSTKSLDYEQAGQTYEGFLAMPESTPKAVVLVSHAWGGQNEFDHEIVGCEPDSTPSGWAMTRQPQIVHNNIKHTLGINMSHKYWCCAITARR